MHFRIASIPVLVFLAFPMLYGNAQAGVTEDTRIVLDQNPQLRKVEGFPNYRWNKRRTAIEGDLGPSARIDNCSEGPRVDMGLSYNDRPKCLHVSFRGAAHSYESGFEKTRKFEAVLAPNSTKVTRVYETGMRGSGKSGRSQLLAAFDASGHTVSGPGPIFDVNKGETKDIACGGNIPPRVQNLSTEEEYQGLLAKREACLKRQSQGQSSGSNQTHSTAARENPQENPAPASTQKIDAGKEIGSALGKLFGK